MNRPMPVLSMRLTPVMSKTMRFSPWASAPFNTASIRSPSGPRITLPSSEITTVAGATSFWLISSAIERSPPPVYAGWVFLRGPSVYGIVVCWLWWVWLWGGFGGWGVGLGVWGGG